MDRRAFLKAAGGTVGGAAVLSALDLAGLPAAHAAAAAATTAPPFTLGVASGDPLPDGVVLWTRLAPDPLVPGGGMPARRYEVEWQVASDERFRRVVRRGRTHARPEDGHSVHVTLEGLRPDATYWYRFRAAGETSPVGRTRTAAHPRSRPHHLRFATASCQQWQEGFYNAHRAMADEDLAFVAFLGDYIYESRPSATALRSHDGTGEPVTLDQYRARHALYKTDPDLQACHAAFPWIVTFDDHELDNNWADEIPQDPNAQPHDQFLLRRAAAFKAWYEHMPVRRSSRPTGPGGIDIQVYRRFVWGDLLQVDVLDTRQHRTDQPPDLAGAEDPAASMLGADQERWLSHGLARSHTRWNALAQQTMVAQNDRTAGPTETFDFDNWDGYRAARRRLLADLQRVDNPVVLTGDRHASWICDLKQDFYDPASPTIGAELTGTSISSGSDPVPELFHAVFDPIMVDSPHWKFIDNRRGYLVCDLDRRRWQTDLRVVSTVRSPEATVSTFASFVTEAGRRGVEVAHAPVA